jgi:hypothetical protein
MKDLARKVNFFVSYVILSKLKAEKEHILSTSLEKLFFPLKNGTKCQNHGNYCTFGFVNKLRYKSVAMGGKIVVIVEAPHWFHIKRQTHKGYKN